MKRRENGGRDARNGKKKNAFRICSSAEKFLQISADTFRHPVLALQAKEDCSRSFPQVSIGFPPFIAWRPHCAAELECKIIILFFGRYLLETSMLLFFCLLSVIRRVSTLASQLNVNYLLKPFRFLCDTPNRTTAKNGCRGSETSGFSSVRHQLRQHPNGYQAEFRSVFCRRTVVCVRR